VSEFWQGWWLIGAIHLLAAASPGPDFLFATRHTLRYGRANGLWCSLGITLGLSVHLLYSLLGLAALIATSEGIMSAIRYLGGGYLIYLGIKGVRARSVNFGHGVAESASKPKPWKSVALGFGCNLKRQWNDSNEPLSASEAEFYTKNPLKILSRFIATPH